MPSTITVSKIIHSSGKIFIQYDDGALEEYNSVDELKESLAEIDSDKSLTRQLLLAWWSSRDTDLSNVNLIEGKEITFDLSRPNPITVR